jgi:hypothetical protein
VASALLLVAETISRRTHDNRVKQCS